MTIQEQLERDEGLRLSAYLDSEGYWTIGIGRLIDSRRGGGITREEAVMLLDNDILQREMQLTQALPWVEHLDYVRRGALINMCFNLGIYGLLGFKKTLAAIEVGDYDKAAAEMLDSKWSLQVGERAKRLSDQMRTGQWV